MNYKNIQGWFNFEQVYIDQVTKNDNCIFLEIGAWKGKSTIFLAEEIIRQNKNIRIFSVDFWEDEKNEAQYSKLLKGKTPLYQEFMNNVIATEMQDVIIPFKMTSDQFFDLFKGTDSLFQFIYIDGAHDYEQVKKDIENAQLFIKDGGTIAGHDYHAPGVKQAVTELLGDVELYENTWIKNL